MRLALLLILLSLAGVGFSQNPQKRIGEIDFYGYAGLNLDRIRAALPIREGDEYPGSHAAFFRVLDGVREAVKQTVGKPPTDVAPVCCDAQDNGMIYVGLSGHSMKPQPYNPVPTDMIGLPARIVTLYHDAMEESARAVRAGTVSEDDSRGYSVSTSLALRAKQLATREYAIHHERLTRRVLETSKDTEQRVVAAYVMGYARRSSKQIPPL